MGKKIELDLELWLEFNEAWAIKLYEEEFANRKFDPGAVVTITPTFRLKLSDPKRYKTLWGKYWKRLK